MGLKKFNEFVQLDEISKKTLGNYIMHAAQSYSNHSSERDKARERADAISRTGYGASQDAKKAISATTDAFNKDSNRHDHKRLKRGQGIQRAVKRLTAEGIESFTEEEIDDLFENFEQLDELSKQTLGNYIKKASDDGMQRAYEAGGGTGHDRKGKDQAFDHAKKRLKGVRKATDKLVKEGADELSFEELELLGEGYELLSELSKKTLNSYIRKARDDVKRKDIRSNLQYRAAAMDHQLSFRELDPDKRAAMQARSNDHAIKGSAAAQAAEKRKAGIKLATDKKKLAEEDLSESKTHLLHTDKEIPGTREAPKRIQVTTGRTKHDVHHGWQMFGHGDSWSTRNHKTGEVTHHNTAEELVNHLTKAGHKGLKPEHFSRDQFHRQVGTKQTFGE